MNNTHQISVFNQIVKDKTNTAHLLAYSLHIVSVEDWRETVLAKFSREPSEDEQNIFMVGETTTRRLAAYQNQAEIMLQNHHGSQGLCGSNDTPKSQSVGFADSQNVLVNAKIGQNKWTKGTMAALRIPSDTNLKALGKSLLILFVLVGLLAVAVNYAKAKFF